MINDVIKNDYKVYNFLKFSFSLVFLIRYLAVCHPMRTGYLSHVRGARKICVAIWILSCALASPMAAVVKVTQNVHPENERTTKKNNTKHKKPNRKKPVDFVFMLKNETSTADMHNQVLFIGTCYWLYRLKLGSRIVHSKILDVPPLDPISFIFVQFSAKFDQIVGHINASGYLPLLGNPGSASAMMLFTLNIKMIKGAAHKNGDLVGTCKGSLKPQTSSHKKVK